MEWFYLGSSFQVESIISDVDGNQYRTVKIGSQEWMAENLRTSKYRNGEVILHITNDTTWSNLASGAYCWFDNDSATYENPYGKLYNWYTIDDGRGLCPSGWHIPSDLEYLNLFNFLGGQNVAGGKMKETAYWDSPNTGATNESGFTGLPGGLRNVNGAFSNNGDAGSWWSSWDDESEARSLSLDFHSIIAYLEISYKKIGFSVRCLRD